ncbi:MAG: tetratricopeptide repeat protein [Bdellovibrionales bacterium]|nr:tetratricopeptide repeat protein [Bdellovibrionales bacterium]
MRIRAILISFLPCLLAACSPMAIENQSLYPSSVRVNEAEQGIIDDDIEKESQALHAFLVGQLSYQDEDLDTAVLALSKTSDLLESPQPLIHLQLAQLSLQKEDYERALLEVRRAQAESADDVYLKLYEAGILDVMHSYDEAANKYIAILEKHPSSEVVILLASVFYRAGQVDKAIEALKSSKDSSQTKLYEALMLEANKQYESAVTVLRDYTKINNDNIAVNFVLVRNLVKQGKINEARTYLKDLSKKEKQSSLIVKVSEAADLVDSPEAMLGLLNFIPPAEEEIEGIRLELALQAVQAREFRGALRDVLIHLAMHPEDSSARYYLASIFAGAGRRKQAIEEIFKIKPGQEMFVKSRTFATFLLRQDGQLDLAEKAAREALAVEPDNQKIISYLVLILRSAGKFESAKDLLADAVDKAPNNDKLLFSYAIVLSDLGRQEESLKIMQRLIDLNPNNSDALNFVAYAFAESSKNLDKALEYANRSLNLRPNDGFYMDTLGWVYYKLGRLVEAEQSLKNAMKLTGEDVVIAEHYGDVLKELGKREMAFEVYKVAVEKARDDRSPDEDVAEARLRMEQKLKELGEISE